jgi:hypothetical protein
MMRTISITSLLIFAVVCGACGAARPPVSEPPEPAAARVTELPRPGEPLWPASARRVQVIVTGVANEPQSLVWVVSEGTNLIAVYRVAAAGYVDAQARIARANPLVTVIMHPGGEPGAPPPVPPGGAQALASNPIQCPGGPCIYVPWTPPANGPVVPPDLVRVIQHFTSALDALYRSSRSATTGAAQ